MKKRWTLVMASAALLTLGACGSEEKTNDTASPQPVSQEGTTIPVAESDGTSSTETSGEKDAYLQKLADMVAEDKENPEDQSPSESGTMAEMELEETERFKKWDAEMNAVYSQLTEQLTGELLNELTSEQENWMAQRDVLAKEASDKLEGGSGASLEFVATKASLTRDRTFELVAHYMN